MKTHPLPILETLYKSIAWPWYYRKQLGLALLPMFLVMACLEFLSLYISGMDEEKRSLLIALASIPFGILYTITVHRFLILGPDATPKFGMFEWRGREWNFLLYSTGLSILLGLIAAIPLMAFFSSAASSGQNAFNRLIMFIVCLPAFLVFARLSLVLPAIAIDADFSFSEAWHTGRGNTLRLAAIVYCVPVAIMVFNALLPDWTHRNLEALITVILALLGYALWAIEIACLSFAYRYLLARPEQS